MSELFSAVKRKRDHLTILVGAGISMNASLPSWRELVWNMAQQIGDETLREMVCSQSSDSLERRAETIINIACAANPDIDAAQIIRDALYRTKVPTPGILALSIGRLVALYFPNVSVLTTNFDLVLEGAIANYLPKSALGSYSLDSYRDWQHSEKDDSKLGILHLHGVVRQSGKPPLTPLVLKDSDFLEHGAEVRSAVADAISTGVSIFAGLSLTDPNLVGPLYEKTDPGSAQRYGLFVPRLHGGRFGPEQHALLALSEAEFLKEKLALRPIFAKSYSQLNQLISELALAVGEPSLYRRNAPRSQSLHYGTRFKQELARAYSSIGGNPRTGELDESAALALSRKLRDALRSSHGPTPLLARFRRKYRSSVAATENFGVFLWLRSLDRGGEKKYALNLVGTSVYTHLESWSSRREVPIVGDSDYAAVHAIFEGVVKAENLDPGRNGQMWRGVVAVPLIVNESRCTLRVGADPLDTLVIGAITLDSTACVDAESAEGDALSVVSQLGRHEFQKIVDALNKVAGVVLS
ncbi:MAG TPA: SIR2 family protein [Aldersonia sp.]